MRALLLLGAVALVSSGCVANVTFSGTKEVTGEESTGPFVVRITCPGALPETQDLTFAGPGTETSSVFVIDEETTCTISEIEQAGATTVTYECGEIELIITEESFGGGGPGMSAARGIDEDVTCTAGEEDITVDVNEPVLATVNFTVINDFPVAPTTTTTTAPPTPAAVEAAAPTPVPAQVIAFTG